MMRGSAVTSFAASFRRFHGRASPSHRRNILEALQAETRPFGHRGAHFDQHRLALPEPKTAATDRQALLSHADTLSKPRQDVRRGTLAFSSFFERRWARKSRIGSLAGTRSASAISAARFGLFLSRSRRQISRGRRFRGVAALGARARATFRRSLSFRSQERRRHFADRSANGSSHRLSRRGRAGRVP